MKRRILLFMVVLIILSGMFFFFFSRLKRGNQSSLDTNEDPFKNVVDEFVLHVCP